MHSSLTLSVLLDILSRIVNDKDCPVEILEELPPEDVGVRALCRQIYELRQAMKSLAHGELDVTVGAYGCIAMYLRGIIELLKGIELARIASGLDKAYYGIEKNKQDAIDLLLSKNPAQYGVEIVPENVKYPQGAEKMQIKAITNREVKPGGLPSGVGCNVISTQTAYAIYRACYEGMPSIERVLTVAGSAMGDKSYNLQCRFGTPFSYIVEQCGGFVVEPKKIVLGGPMMGLIATNLEAPNIKGTAGILFFTDKEDRSVENPTCIHCGKCLTVCPMKLEPLYMYKYFQNRDFENMQKYHILDCFECGSCSYNCPGRLPLTHTFKTAKLLFAARAAEEKARAEAAAKEAETK